MESPKQIDGCVVEEMDGEIVIYNPLSEMVVHINETGRLVWGLCDGLRKSAEITTLLSQAYPDSAEQIKAEIPALLERLARHQLIEWV